MTNRRRLNPRFQILLLATLAGCGEQKLQTEAVAEAKQQIVFTGPKPERPANTPEVHLVVNDPTKDPQSAYTRPIIPAFRTTADGRIGVDMADASELELFLLSPEKLAAQGKPPLAPGAVAGPEVVIDEIKEPDNQLPDGTVPENEYSSHGFFKKYAYDGGRFRNVAVGSQTICDVPTGLPPRGNPHPCNYDATNVDPAGTIPANDCYDLKMITVVEFEKNTQSGWKTKFQLWSKDFTVVVENPKTLQAKFRVVFSSNDATPGSEFFGEEAQEPTITTDGRLFVARLGHSEVEPSNGNKRNGLDPSHPDYESTPAKPLDIVYSTYPTYHAPCDVTKWTSLEPMSKAYTDPQMQGRYGIAAYPFLDSLGNPILNGEDLHVSYPWIDREGKNLFFTAIRPTLFSKVKGSADQVVSRYEEQCAGGATTCFADPTYGEVTEFEEPLNFRGVGVAGLWTHGKMVLFDNIINNIDYGLGRRNGEQRDLKLYDDAVNPWIRAGSGSYPGGGAMEHSTGNFSFIDSMEQLWNWNEMMVPLTMRDVVWTVNTGKVSAEVPFDDYIDPNALIIAEMSGAIERNNASSKFLKYYDGVELTEDDGEVNLGVQGEVRFQNAATSPDWNLPKYGQVHGNVRLEPVALGGIEGKGAWLDGTGDAISFAMPMQPPGKSYNNQVWYLSVFVDRRFPDDTTRRELFTFPNGGEISFVGTNTIQYENASGTITDTIDISGATWPTSEKWLHLAFVLDQPANTTRLYVNGLRWKSTSGTFPINGTFYVGDGPDGASDQLAKGFRGWIDEVKLLAYEPNPEVACNHARGTIMRVSSASGDLLTLANAYPLPTHAAIRSALNLADTSKFVCYHDYKELFNANPRVITPGKMATRGLTHARDALLFPNGPLMVDAPRPDASGNAFCVSCHPANGQFGLSAAALAPLPNVNMQDDIRRQPMQPPAYMLGNVPPGLIGKAPYNGPATHQTGWRYLSDRNMYPNPPPPSPF